MPERIPSDHDAVETHRVRLAAVGRTERVQVELPGKLRLEREDVIWLALDGDGCFARVSKTLDGTPVVGRVVDNRRQAREAEGTDRLHQWATEAGLSAGDSLPLDVLAEGYAYGLRAPGARVVYAPPDEPDASLADIARDVESE